MPEPSTPTDLRLVPAAAACWLTAGLAVAGSSGSVRLGGGAVVALAAALLTTARWAIRRRGSRRVDAAVVRAEDHHPPGGPRSAWGTAWLAVAATGAVLLTCSVQLHARESGLLPDLVTERAVVEVTGVVRAEPVPVADRWGDGVGADLRGADQGTSAASTSPTRFRSVVAVEEVTGRGRTGPAAAGVLVLGGPQWSAVPYGARVRIEGRLGPGRPGDRLPALMTTWGEVTLVDRPGQVDRAVNRLRAGLLEVTDDLSPDARGLVPGAAIGDTSRLPADLEQAMRDVSLTHVTAVSGSHFAVLAVGVLALTAALRLPRQARALVLVLVMGGFVLLVHPAPSVVRAAVMGAVAAVGMVLGRRSRALPALAASVVVLLLLDPWLSRSFGFALSVLATGAIVLLAPPLATVLRRVLPGWLALAIAVPVAAQAACAPVVVLLDPGVSMYAVPANILAAPALVPATLLGVVATVTAPFSSTSAAVLAQGASFATWWIAAVAHVGAGLPGARLAWPAGIPGATALAFLTGTVGLAAVLVTRLRGRGRRALVATFCFAVVLVLGIRAGAQWLQAGSAAPADWQLVMCDVGQGDALVMRSGPHSAVVVDVGPDNGAAARCLDDLDVDRIDLLVLSHHHEDHVGGLAAVLAGRETVAALVSPLAEPAEQADGVLRLLTEAGIPVAHGTTAPQGGAPTVERSPDGGEGRRPGAAARGGTAGDVRWTVLWPADPVPHEPNDASVVVLLETTGLGVLALGDVEPPAQERLAAALADGPPSVDVVKVAHHGSSHQSPRLAELFTPAVALIGVGSENTYGHPSPATTDLHRSRGALVLATADCGSITLSPAGGSIGGAELLVTARCLG